jgi:hypothetical protein
MPMATLRYSGQVVRALLVLEHEARTMHTLLLQTACSRSSPKEVGEACSSMS